MKRDIDIRKLSAYVAAIGMDTSPEPLKVFEDVLDTAFKESVDRLAFSQPEGTEYKRGYMAALLMATTYNRDARDRCKDINKDINGNKPKGET